MNIEDLYKFKVIAEEQNITRAAEKLFTSQPALSYVLSKVEAELGCTLFERNKNSILLNEKGRTALKYAERVLADMDEMKKALRNDAPEELRIFSAILATLRYFVGQYLLEYPDQTIRTSLEKQNDLESLLYAGKADIVISTKPFEGKDVRCMPFFEERAMILVPKGHPLFGRQSIALRELEGETIYTMKNTGYFYDNICSLIESENLDINIYEFDDYYIYRTALKTRPLLFLLNSLAITYLELNQESVPVEVVDPDSRCLCYLCYLKNNRSRCASFSNWVKRRLETIEKTWI